MKLDLKGIITPVVTVFDDSENIDENGFRKIINYLIDHGVYGIFISGGSMKDEHGVQVRTNVYRYIRIPPQGRRDGNWRSSLTTHTEGITLRKEN